MEHNTYPLYGFLWDVWGDEAYLSTIRPFFKDGDNVIYTPDARTEMFLSVAPAEKKFLRQLDTNLTGQLNDVILLSGQPFVDKLNLVEFENDFSTWNEVDGFLWKLASVEERDKLYTAIYDHATAWLTNHLKTQPNPVREPVKAATALIRSTLPKDSIKSEYILTGLAAKLIKDNYSYTFQAHVVKSAKNSQYPTEEAYYEAVEKLEKELRPSFN